MLDKFLKSFFSYCFLAALMLPIYAFGQAQTFTLDQAIAESMDYAAEKLPQNTKVAVLKVKAVNDELTEYIGVECDNHIKDNTPLSLASKKTLPNILKQTNIADLNEASEEDAIKVAGLLGAKAVIFVGFYKLDGKYKFFMQMYDVETAQTNGTLSLDVELDELLADFTGEEYISPQKRREMEREEELARVKRELEELKSQRTAGGTANKGDAFSELNAIRSGEAADARTYLESQMKGQIKERQAAGGSQKSIAKMSVIESKNIGEDEQIVVIAARKVGCFLDVYFDGEFALRMSEKTTEYFALKKGEHILTIARVEKIDRKWRVSQTRDTVFELVSRNPVKFKIKTSWRWLKEIQEARIEKTPDYPYVFRVNTEPNTNKFANVEVETRNEYSVFSMRHQWPVVSFGKLGIGQNIEFGSIKENGLYLTANLNLGWNFDNGYSNYYNDYHDYHDYYDYDNYVGHYYGIGLNVGIAVGKDKSVKNVFGIAAGFGDAPNKKDVIRNHSYSFGGVFHKLMLGGTGNFDITNKLLFGMRGRYEYDYSTSMISKRHFSATYSCEYGFTLTKKKEK